MSHCGVSFIASSNNSNFIDESLWFTFFCVTQCQWLHWWVIVVYLSLRHPMLVTSSVSHHGLSFVAPPNASDFIGELSWFNVCCATHCQWFSSVSHHSWPLVASPNATYVSQCWVIIFSSLVTSLNASDVISGESLCFINCCVTEIQWRHGESWWLLSCYVTGCQWRQLVVSHRGLALVVYHHPVSLVVRLPSFFEPLVSNGVLIFCCQEHQEHSSDQWTTDCIS